MARMITCSTNTLFTVSAFNHTDILLDMCVQHKGGQMVFAVYMFTANTISAWHIWRPYSMESIASRIN